MNPKVKRNNKSKERRPKTLGRQTESVPCYKRALIAAGLAHKDISLAQAFELFLKVGTLVKAMNPKHKLPRVAAPYAATIFALSQLKDSELSTLRIRVAEFR
jgi:hypothetical protein